MSRGHSHVESNASSTFNSIRSRAVDWFRTNYLEGRTRSCRRCALWQRTLTTLLGRPATVVELELTLTIECFSQLPCRANTTKCFTLANQRFFLGMHFNLVQRSCTAPASVFTQSRAMLCVYVTHLKACQHYANLPSIFCKSTVNILFK